MPDYNKSYEDFDDSRKINTEAIDPYWDTMISNPEYRRAYNTAEGEGYRGEEAHIIATINVWDEEKAVEKFSHEAVKELVGDEDYDWNKMNEDEDEDASGDQEEELDDRNDEDQDGQKEVHLSDFEADR